MIVYPSTRYSSVCNVLRQWNISLIPTYRVYRLYDTGIVGELLKYGGSGMVDLLEQLFGRRRLSPGNGERALLLIFLRKRIERILVIIGVSPYSVL